MDNKIIEQATAFVRKQLAKNNDHIPEWGKFQKLVEEHLEDGFKLKFKMPPEYQYAYLRGKGLSHSDSLEAMGIDSQAYNTVAPRQKIEAKKSFWKFW